MIGLIEGFNHPDPENRTQLRDRSPTFEILRLSVVRWSVVRSPRSVVRGVTLEHELGQLTTDLMRS